MKNSKIEWCDHTFNPWIGCTKVSAGCANCYAAALDKRWGKDRFGKGKARTRTSENYWTQPLKWNQDWLNSNTEYGKPHGPLAILQPRPRVFCASLADWLDDEVPIEWLADLLDLIRRTPELDWLLLTKRPENWRRRLGRLRAEFYAYENACKSTGKEVGEAYRNACKLAEYWLFGASCLDDSHKEYRHETRCGQPPANVWIGTTVENQEMADKRLPELLQIPARVRFLSCEPLLGSVCLPVGRVVTGFPSHITAAGHAIGAPLAIHWVICGGESGHHARPMHPDWARSLRDQCQCAGVPFLFKQWGEWLPEEQCDADGYVTPDDKRVGKVMAGRFLDGVEHNGFPEVVK